MTHYQFEDSNLLISSIYGSKVIKYEDIISVKKANFFSAFLAACDLFRPPMLGMPSGLAWNLVLIETSKRKYIAITPKNSEEFVRVLRERMANSTHQP